MKTINVGDEVRYPETFRGIKWVKVGNVVEVGTGAKDGRVRVLWTKWVYADGESPDGKRTWVAAKKLQTARSTDNWGRNLLLRPLLLNRGE